MIFSKEQFNAGLRFPLPPLFKEFLHFTQIPPVFIHPNIVRVLMGCSIINMLFNLDITLLEVFFVYSLRKVKNDIFSMSAHLPSLQLVTELPDSTKGGATGHVVVRGAWAGLLEHPARPFSPNYSLVVPGPELRGHLVDWVEKASFGCLSKLFEIDAKERQCNTLLTARNLAAVVRESREYVINILPRKMPKEVVPGEHYTVKDFPIYEALKEADSKKRRLLLEGREKKKNEGTLRKAPGQKGDADSSPKKDPVKRRKLVKKHGKDTKEPTPPLELLLRPLSTRRSTSLTAVARLANMAEEAASVNHPDSRNLDADAAEAVCATPTEEVGVENQSQPSDDPDRLALVLVTGPPSKKARSVRNLRSGLHGRLQERQQEIEVSCSSAHDTHPEGGEVEMVTEISAVPVVVSDEIARGVSIRPGDPVNDASCTSASPVSYAELEEKLKQIPPGLPLAKPSAQMFEMVETLIHRSGENEALRADLADAKVREESMDARLLEAANEMADLRGEVRQLRTEVSIEKKQREDLQLRLIAQKEELEREFAVEREEIEAEYQKQVDDTFIFGYRCCMKKNGIKRDTPSIPPGDEKKLHEKLAP
ncbi:hypothetical protein CK203_041723 [Vitis vinifera]|uniref:Uncharacterized protein n=1 Tax=Vitis vinifera TaxID=29760 RepID=A0A438HCS6_VITVI|nr:hypothetical protein CK203_041723 [Vitis vinifera]